MKIPERIGIKIASRKWLNTVATKYHYMHRPIHNVASPFGWQVTWDGSDTAPDGQPYGFIVFCSVHFTRLRGEFGYPGLPTRWQVLSLARLWLHDDLPCNSETCVIAKAHKLVQRRWLEVHPPRFWDQPYHILKILSFSDDSLFKGTIYKAANFRFIGTTISVNNKTGNRGPGMNGHTLSRWVYDLPTPRWEPVRQMALFTGDTQ